MCLRTTRIHTSVSHRFLPLFILLITIAAPAAMAQTSATDGTTSAAVAPGAPAGAYGLSEFEHINLYNGNLNASFKLVHVGGRGSAAYTMTLPIEQHWKAVNGSYDPFHDGNIVYYSGADSHWWEGLKPGYSPGVVQSRTVAGQPGNCNPEQFGGGGFNAEVLTRLTFTAPDGSENELVDSNTNGAPHFFGVCGYETYSRGTKFIAKDGSATTFISDQPIVENNVNYGVDVVTGVLLFADGTRYRIDNGVVSWIRDRNGNKLTFAYGTNPAEPIGYQRLLSVTDSLDRQVTISYANMTSVFYDQISFKGFNGATRTIRVWYSSLGSALRSGYALSNYYHLFPDYGGNPNDPTLFNPTIISRIELPDTRSYEFKYNPYSELARVVLPTGGAIEYDHTAGSGVLCYDYPYCTMSEVYRRTIERRVYTDGTSQSLESKTTYGGEVVNWVAPDSVVVDHLNPAGILLAREKHYFGGVAIPSSLQPVYWSFWQFGKELKTEYISVVNGVAGSVLRREEFLWQQRENVSWCTAQFGCTQAGAPPNDPRLVQTTTTLVDTNQVSKTTNLNPQTSVAMMDQFNNETDTWVYDFGPGAPGALLRHVHVDYVTTNPVNGVDYTNRTTTTSPHLLRLPRIVSIYDAADVLQGRSEIEYDGYIGTNRALPVDRTNISGLDPSFTSSYRTRGNTTVATRYLITNGSPTGSVIVYSQYDVAGNKVRLIDARNYATNFDFSDRFGAPDGEARANAGGPELNNAGHYSFAYPTLATNALGQTAYAQYDYYTGQKVDAEDANGVTSSISYNDLLDRPTQSIIGANRLAPMKMQQTISYQDASHLITVTSDQTTFNDNAMKTEQLYDGMGRPIENREYENSSNFIATQTRYDSFSRVYKTSNPFRQGEPIVWTITNFDSLGRVDTVMTPDNAVTQNFYSGNRTLVRDQTGKERLSLENAIGKLKDVWEITTADSATEAVSFPGRAEVTAGYHTVYSWDAIDNLRTVTQGSQTRTFDYDSLKRLKSTTLPESGFMQYGYDNNGNQTSLIDARNITTTYAYDALNRRTSKTFTNDPNNTPAVSYFYDNQTLPGTPPTFARGASIGRLVAVLYGSGNSGDYFGYDDRGRFILKLQQLGGINYKIERTYDVAGDLKTHKYPSDRVVNFDYDVAGRVTSVTGNLGSDQIMRNYAINILYSSLGGLAKEQFGMDTPVYNKLFYNIRGQLAEIRVSTSYTGPTDTNWNRGAIINNYSDQCAGVCAGSSMTDNNGSLKKQDVYIPNDDQISGFTLRSHKFDYDPLNRLNYVSELNSSGTELWRQSYTYDRFGNRKINQGATTQNIGLNSMQAAVVENTTTNRMYAPLETEASHPLMNYDSAGNQTKDYYTDSAIGIVYDRTYDAENRMTTSVASISSPVSTKTSTYTYDGQGNRVKRNIAGTETWQVYDVDGKLLAEYPANGAANNPTKEYGYRNGQLLVVASGASSAGRANFASSANGGTATAQNYTQDGVFAGYHFYPSSAIDGQRYGHLLASGTDINYFWRDEHTLPSWLEVTFNGAKTIDEIDVFTIPECPACLTQADPSPTQTFSQYGTTGFDVQYWTGSSWVTVPTGSITGNNLVWRKLTFAPITTSKIRVVVNAAATDGVARIAEVEAWGSTSAPMSTNVALSANGGTATAQNYTQDGVFAGYHFYPSSAIDGQRYGHLLASGTDINYFWRDEHGLPSWLEVTFNGAKTIDEIDVFTIPECPACLTQADPSPTQTFSQYGTTGFDVQYWTGSSWVTVPTGSITGNNLVWRKLTFAPITTSKIRIVATAAATDGVARIAEVEAWTTGSGGTESGSTVKWMVTDQLGTPRMILDQTGALAPVRRHDYLPFGEELSGSIGGRSAPQGYATDTVLRQRFTEYERDLESGLDYAHARYYSSAAGRFTSADPLLASANPFAPQSWNRYAYVLNNPVNSSDPTGLGGDWYYDTNAPTSVPIWKDSDPGGNWKRWTDTYGYVYRDTAKTGFWVALDPNGSNAYLTNSQARAEQALEGFMSGGFRYISMTKAQREYMGGFTEGVSPAGPLVFLINHIEGMDTSSREYKAGLLVGVLVGAGLQAGANVANVMRELTPTSQAVQQAERALKNGATEVTVKTEEEAAEVFLRNYQHEGYYNTTGMTGNEVRNDQLLFPEKKGGTYHWDFADTQHGGRPHLQVEPRKGQKIRIFFERRVEE